MILDEKELKYLRHQKKMLDSYFLNHPMVIFLLIFGITIPLIRLFFSGVDPQSKYSGIIEATFYWGCGVMFFFSGIWMRNRFMRIVEKLYTSKSGRSL